VDSRPLWNDELLRSPHQVADKDVRVRSMFNHIAQRYERTNTICSGGRDATWRKAAVDRAEVAFDDDVLDVACGTGDLTRALAARRPRSITGCDFAHQMLTRAVASSGPLRRWVEADALRLPFADRTFSLVTCAFGVRNFVDLNAGLREFRRVLKPFGRVVILEFARPRSRLFRFVYETYAGRVMPWAATWISGDRSGAYRYLPRSVVSFPDAEQMRGHLARAGFEVCTATPRTFGAVIIYGGRKPGDVHP
jgi:demethylmenaquinone methyltransferase/2-methoxy-6-polyprenyl-1,4-benzoquinol methylase